MHKSKLFRQLLEKPGLVLRPCGYDALSALLIENAGFKLMGTSGYAISASAIGQPDLGLISFGELLERARNLINSVSIPVDVDADTGYGNALNAYWTAKNYIWVDAAGIRIEDQTWPKRCGHMSGKSIISKNEMVSKIAAMIRARDEEGRDLVIGARTDARAIEGIDKTIERAMAYAKAGADYIYVECPQSLEEVKQLVMRIEIPLAFNLIPGGKTPLFSISELERIGVKYLSIPMVCLYPAAKAMSNALQALKNGDLEKVGELGINWSEFNVLMGGRKWRQLEGEFGTASQPSG
ncbi:MAG: isocitrate lyase/PEP mutase family protein [Methanothrix sp.]|jgi:methylisocitrate lyase|nr:isocitrate lyase/PEP mutase family protein [Methanothrix sp.]